MFDVPAAVAQFIVSFALGLDLELVVCQINILPVITHEPTVHNVPTAPWAQLSYFVPITVPCWNVKIRWFLFHSVSQVQYS